MKYHALFFQKLGKMLQNLSSAAVVIGAVRVKIYTAVENVQIVKLVQFCIDSKSCIVLANYHFKLRFVMF